MEFRKPGERWGLVATFLCMSNLPDVERWCVQCGANQPMTHVVYDGNASGLKYDTYACPVHGYDTTDEDPR